jgi:hypothetical protein
MSVESTWRDLGRVATLLAPPSSERDSSQFRAYTKNIYSLSMAGWLTGEFVVFGIHFQNWMPIAVALIAVWIITDWMFKRRG